ncbi:crotonase/enoyl-CoA hydratase family protein [Bosea sp. RCC_152_1]|uniref:crotonase/enoyl-CoA hydratase family protein n=1 Tax=Bosea sp. RCC_152_1 TaxID=3239228 RepID=UPI0035243C4A
MSDAVLYDMDDRGIVILTLNRPDLRNPISDEDVLQALLAALDRLQRDRVARVAILTGAGSAFSSGGNLKKMGKGGGLNDLLPARTRLNYRFGIQKLPLAFETLEVPVIAAVNGPAIGAGCDLTLMCDLRVASEKAIFAESFVKIGIVPGDGGAWLLPRIVGFSKACEMALTGEPVDAAEARAIGLVSSVVPHDELLDAARRLAMRIAVNPPHAVRMTKRLLREAWTARLEPLLEMSAAMQALAHETQDHREAVAALLEKRAPNFTGE